MQTKMLNVNGKVLLGVFSVILVITAITMIQVVLSAPGGNGRVRGNSCMSRCLKITADSFDGSKAEVQNCKSQCIGTDEDEGNCLVSQDDCCVPYIYSSGDPDCEEFCDGLDNDGDGEVDEDFPDLGIFCTVGIGECQATGIKVCTEDGTGTECNATEGTPTSEVCDGLDNNCNGLVDEDLVAPLADKQKGVCEGSLKVCDGINGWIEPDYTLISGYETVEVSCDDLDNDCDGSVDEDVTSTFYQDNDGDSYGNPAVSIQACTAPTDYVADNTDCDDTDQSVNPGATEVCDGLDNDCDGLVDEGCPTCTDVTIHVQYSNGNPIEGASVYIYETDFTLVDSGLTDSNGDYKICLESGEYIVRAYLPDVTDYKDVTITVPDNTTITIEF